jgi:hypothetical protein
VLFLADRRRRARNRAVLYFVVALVMVAMSVLGLWVGAGFCALGILYSTCS